MMYDTFLDGRNVKIEVCNHDVFGLIDFYIMIYKNKNMIHSSFCLLSNADNASIEKFHVKKYRAYPEIISFCNKILSLKEFI